MPLLPFGGLVADVCSLQTTGPHCWVGRLLWWPASCVAVVLISDLLAPSHQAATAAAAVGSRFLLLATCSGRRLGCLAVLHMLL